jgi:hypothetical protein
VDFDGQLLARGGEGYERARRAAVWNGLTPKRWPELVVLADSERDVVRAVRLANERGLTIGVRSGGHSWAGNHVRDGGMLLDLSRLRAVEVDERSMSASVQPGTVATSCCGSWRGGSCSSRPVTAPEWRSAAICCRAAMAGTGACTDRRA